MLKLIESINSEKENVVRNLNVLLIKHSVSVIVFRTVIDVTC